MMKKQLILIFIVSIGFSIQAQDPDPELFQTWYLYYDAVDLGEPQYYYGEDVPQMIINPDLSFTAIDNCWDITGNFEYIEGDTIYDFFLETTNFEEDCILGGSSGYILKLLYESSFPLGGYLFEGGNTTELYLEYGAGFGLGFRNQITLSVPEEQLQEVKIFPNPVTNIISISETNDTIQKVQIITLTGEIVNTFEEYNDGNYDVSDLSQGIYFLKITSRGVTSIKKFIKQ